MSPHTLVVDYHEELIKSFNGAAFVVRTGNFALASEIYKTVHDANSLFAIKVSSDARLAELPLSEEHRDIPMALYLAEAGRYADVDSVVERLRGFNSRIFFPADKSCNLISCRILSSMGIATGLYFTGAEPDWNALADLAAYTMYGKSPHAPIEPFYYLLTHYNQAESNSWQAVFFNNPQYYLHLSKDGQIALRMEDIESGNFIAHDIADIPSITENPAFQDALESWREFFLKAEGCAYCDVWRVCLGEFEGVCSNKEDGCKKFFREMLAAAEEHLKVLRNRRALWQP
ncbi:MAG: hypothetical protein HQK89_03170 [Nitrospirae bacterium]|nr:hypothetical protein [Nitrospirota bacterium]